MLAKDIEKTLWDNADIVGIVHLENALGDMHPVLWGSLGSLASRSLIQPFIVISTIKLPAKGLVAQLEYGNATHQEPRLSFRAPLSGDTEMAAYFEQYTDEQLMTLRWYVREARWDYISSAYYAQHIIDKMQLEMG